MKKKSLVTKYTIPQNNAIHTYDNLAMHFDNPIQSNPATKL